MIIDFHTHTFPESIAASAMEKMQAAARMKGYTDGTIPSLLRAMRGAGIDYSVNLPVATNIKQPHKLNLAAIRINEMSGETGLISFGAAHPDDPNWREELHFAVENGIKGIKLHPMYQACDLDDTRFLRIIGEAAALGLIVIVHAGEDIGIPGPSRCSPKHVENVLRETGIDKLVLAHMGGWGIWQEVYDELCGAPVYFDTSFSFGKANFNPDYPRTDEELTQADATLLKNIILKHGAGHILFGTDSPWGDQAETIAYIRSLKLPDSDTDRILSGNARKLLGI